MSNHKSFIYLIKITIGPKNISALIKNNLPVPDSLLETMAKEMISKHINDSYPNEKHYKVQTSEQYYGRMLKQSSFDIEDLNEIDVYDLQLKFKDGAIVNRSPEEREVAKEKLNKETDGKRKTKQSKKDKIESVK